MTGAIVNREELARRMGVSLYIVDKWIDSGECPIVSAGSNGVSYQFDLAEVERWRADVETKAREEEEARARLLEQHQLRLEGGSISDTQLPTAKARAEEAQTMLLENKVRRENLTLIPADEVRADYEAVFRLLTLRLAGHPTLMARRYGLTPEQTRAEREELARLVNDLRLQIADPAFRPPEQILPKPTEDRA